ncbi:MAG: B12-binding domain-containing radical SAM protein [Bacteroidota bacterium]
MPLDVLLTHSYFLRFDPKQQAAHMPYPPLGTLYAASLLRSSDISVRLCDTMLADSEQIIRGPLQEYRPKLLVIYDDDFNYLNKMCLTRMREAAFVMSGIAKEFGIPVIVHGSDAADHAEQYLSHGADVVVVGEGERTLHDVCTALLNDQQDALAAIPGTVFMRDDQVFVSGIRSVQQQLDLIPFPAWDLIDWSAYRKVWMNHHGYFSVNMVTTRGCPYHCNWCAKPIYGQVYNSRSPENVVKEMLLLKETIRPDHIWFADDIFGLKPGWVKRFADVVTEQKGMIPFKIQSRADLLVRPNETAELARAGCTEVWIGAESGSQKILDAMDKGITVAQIADARRLLKQQHVDAAFFLQFGYRGETFDDIQATISMVKELLPDNIGISVSYPLPGTKFYEAVASEMGTKKNWTDSDDLSMMYQGTFSPRFYKQLHRFVHRTFRLQQGLMFLKEALLLKRIPTVRDLRRIGLIVYYVPMLIIDKYVLDRTRRSQNNT